MNDYELKIDLNALNHLGLNLYSNVPSVLSELIANAWDADATEVRLDVQTDDDGKKSIIVRDNGCGMDKTDLQEKFLTVGYQRRKSGQGDRTAKGRKVMGRKGIGKLSIFSIAENVEVYTKKDGQSHALNLNVDDIRRDIEQGQRHYPRAIPQTQNRFCINAKSGTVLVLSDLKKRIQSSINSNLRKRIARRFSIWSEEFKVSVNDKQVSIQDSGYFDVLEFVQIYNGYKGTNFDHLPKDRRIVHEGSVDGHGDVKGWIGLAKASGLLQEGADNLNRLAILARGKVAMENVLPSFAEGGLYTKYLVGELEADFLDATDEDDIATSNRQDFLQDDERFVALRAFIKNELTDLSKARVHYKEKEGVEKAKENPAIEEWLQGMKRDTKAAAERLLSRINVIVTDGEHRTTLYKHGILAFEHLRHKEKLNELDGLDVSNLKTAVRLFSELDDIEASWYYEITMGRLDIIRKLKERVDENALEKVIQQHIHSHLWLLDPSWDRATEAPSMEKSIKVAFEKIGETESAEVKRGRIDIKYKKSTGKHIIIELKRASVKLSTTQLMDQVEKYQIAVEDEDEAEKSGDGDAVETICLVGTGLSDWTSPKSKEESMKILQIRNIRVVTYQQLIREAEISYGNYLEKSIEKGRINALLEKIDEPLSRDRRSVQRSTPVRERSQLSSIGSAIKRQAPAATI